MNEAIKQNFGALLTAVRNGDACLVECTDAKTGEIVVAVCAVEEHEDEYRIIPLAKMFNGDPYEELIPPYSDEQ